MTQAPDSTDRDVGDLAEVPEDQRLDEDPAGDDGMGGTGAEPVDDVPVGEVRWLDGRDPS